MFTTQCRIKTKQWLQTRRDKKLLRELQKEAADKQEGTGEKKERIMRVSKYKACGTKYI